MNKVYKQITYFGFVRQKNKHQGRPSSASNDIQSDIVEDLSKNGKIGDIFIFKVYDKYRLHLLRDFREKYKIDEGDVVLIVTETDVACSKCGAGVRMPGLRLFIVKKENFRVVSKKVEMHEFCITA